jgi:hypothetical protein
MPKKSSTKKAVRKKKEPEFPPIEDSTMGRLSFVTQFGDGTLEYEGFVDVNGKTFQLLLCSDESKSLGTTQRHARMHLKSYKRLIKEATDYVSAKFVPRYNREIRKQYREGLDPTDWPLLDSDDFISSMIHRSTVVHPNGNSSYWFDVGDELQGHGLVLYRDVAKGFTSDDTPG